MSNLYVGAQKTLEQHEHSDVPGEQSDVCERLESSIQRNLLRLAAALNRNGPVAAGDPGNRSKPWKRRVNTNHNSKPGATVRSGITGQCRRQTAIGLPRAARHYCERSLTTCGG